MALYEIPLYERFTIVGKPSAFKKIKCLHIDEVGLFVHHDKKEQLKPDVIRKHLILRKETYCSVEANSPEEAIKIFYAEWDGAKIGGDSPESKALWINKEEKILELPRCDRLRKNKEGQFICGKLIENGILSGNGEFGMCVLGGSDHPLKLCPMTPFREQINDAPIEIVQGFKIIRAQQKELVKANSFFIS